MVRLNVSGPYSTAAGNNPGGSLPTGTVFFLWTAPHPGDSIFPSATLFRSNENELVNPASPAINTVAGGTIIVGSGSKVTHTADLSGRDNPTGTLPLTLYNPSLVAV